MNRAAIAAHAERVLARGVETANDAGVCADAIEDLKAGKAEVWGLPGSALVARVWDGEGGRFLELGPAAGDLRDIFALAPAVEAWAAAAGCLHIEVSFSRPGWERGLRRLGYERHGGVMRKQIAWA